MLKRRHRLACCGHGRKVNLARHQLLTSSRCLRQHATERIGHQAVAHIALPRLASPHHEELVLNSARPQKCAPVVELLGAVVPCRGVDHKLAARERGIACDLRKAQVIAYGEAELGCADVVVCCLPSSEETDGYLDERRLQMLKEGSVLVNVGRGWFIDCEALARVLAEGRLRGAALDVTDPEPLPAGHPLWAEPRCVITPHVAGRGFGSCPETEELICQVVCDNLRRWRAGKPLTHVVL